MNHSGYQRNHCKMENILRLLFEKEMMLDVESNGEFLFKTNNQNYIKWLENRIQQDMYTDKELEEAYESGFKSVNKILENGYGEMNFNEWFKEFKNKK